MMRELVPMTMKRAFWFLAFAGIAMVLPVNALAGPTPTPTPTPNLYRSLDSDNARDAGVVRGTIDAIDYSAGEIVVRSGRERLKVTVVPTTAIYRGAQYQTLSDLRQGDSVTVDVYTIDARLIARTIKLSK